MPSGLHAYMVAWGGVGYLAGFYAYGFGSLLGGSHAAAAAALRLAVTGMVRAICGHGVFWALAWLLAAGFASVVAIDAAASALNLYLRDTKRAFEVMVAPAPADPVPPRPVPLGPDSVLISPVHHRSWQAALCSAGRR